MTNITYNTHSTRHILIGVIFAMLAAIGFSIKSILIKLAFMYHVDSVTLLSLRMAFSLPFFVMMAFLESNKNKRNNSQSTIKTKILTQKDWFTMGGLSTAYYLFNFLDFLGLQTISAGMERMIQFLYPTMTVILSAWLYKYTLSRKVFMAMVLSYAGIALVFMHDITLTHSGIGMGATLVFISALFYAIYLVGSGHIIQRIGANRLTAYAMIIACLASLLQFCLTHSLYALHQPIVVYKLALTMAVLSTVLPVFMLATGMRLIGSASTSLIGSIGPIVTIYLAHIFLNEGISLIQCVGSLLVLASVVFISLDQKYTSKVPV